MSFQYTYSPMAIAAANGALRDLIDAKASPGQITLYDANDVLLATFTLDRPCGVINPATGVLTFSPALPESNAPASGTAYKATLCDGEGLVILTVPVTQGLVAQQGVFVLSTTTVIEGGMVQLLSAALG
jgi:hypothetical protein